MTSAAAADRPLRIGFIGSGFIAHFHLTSFEGVRDAVIAGVTSPTPARREVFAERVNAMGLGPCRAYPDIESMVVEGQIDAVWVLNPNDTRIATFAAIARAASHPHSRLRAVACEKPLARTLAEAREVLRLTEEAGLLHGYLENQLFSTAIARGKAIIWGRAVPGSGRPYLARAAEEHSGPHEPWFWDGKRQGGGVMSDMMCHSVEVGRHLLTAPGAPRDSLRVTAVNGAIGHLKFGRPGAAEALARQMSGFDPSRPIAEDFARGLLRLEDEAGQELIIEATTSWAYVGAGLRLDIELMGPEYAMRWSSLDTGLKLFLSRNVAGAQGEDLVEKQNAEQGEMPIVPDEAGIYGYTLENRHMVQSFRQGIMPMENFHDGLDVVRLIMALYRSAETGTMIDPADALLDTYVPVPARG
ncbi:Gfo/Idh/MocA family protein [Erythrobacter sp. NE805]|uniref:Gfo/Idh/MocA family protein n=1 Tax=Erythrobacter sp. NE805 TaxID=3389875 RepID=UPI00396B1EF1